MTEALMERPPQREADQQEQEILVPCALIDEGFNYRRRFSPAKMASLQADIKVRGLIYGLILRILPGGRYQLLVGNRRFKAWVAEYGLDSKIKAKVRKLTDDEALATMMAENGERQDPSAIEDAEGAARMLGLCNGDRSEAAARLGWDAGKLSRRLALMNAVQSVRDAYLDEKIDLGHVEILAALRKEVQERVIEVLLKAAAKPTVEQLKAMAEHSLQSLEAAIFDRGECGGCQYNTGNQQALFDESFSGTRCTNKECYGQKTEAELEARKDKLIETYQVVRIVRPGDNSTVNALRAEGKRAVGAEQAAACRTCADFGACVSGVPDSLGKTYTDVCFNQTCNDQKVEAHRQQQKSAAEAAQAAANEEQGSGTGQDAQAQGTGAAGPSNDNEDKQAKSGSAARQQPAKASANSIRNAIREYREQIWRAVFQRAVLKLPILQSRALLIALITHRSSYLDGSKGMDQVNKALNTEVPIRASSTTKLLRTLLEFDQAKLAAAFQQMPAYITADMPIDDMVGFLKALEIKLEEHWQVNETFFEILTKTELDAVCQELGIDKAAGKTYASLKNGSKKDFVAAMLKVQGFTYLGAVPKMMRWTSGA
jgi:PRTRC genetic system ParB family protein